jgi:hypothetical protein
MDAPSRRLTKIGEQQMWEAEVIARAFTQDEFAQMMARKRPPTVRQLIFWARQKMHAR